MGKKFLIVIVIGGIAFGAWLLYFKDGVLSDREMRENETAVRSVVRLFGEELKEVSLLASPETAAQSIEEHYNIFLTDELIAMWKQNPSSALGRVVSSPWPDRIEVDVVEQISNNLYRVGGRIIEITSVEETEGGAAAQRPVSLLVSKASNRWLISNVVTGPYDATVNFRPYAHGSVFAIRHPADFEIATGTSLAGGFITPSLVKFSFPDNAFSEEPTNFIEGYAVISESGNPQIIEQCITFADVQNLSNPDTESATINGVEFKTQAVREGAAGNIYDSRLYRTVRNERCYEIAITVRTGNINNYDPPVMQFDIGRAFATLESMAKTFQFVNQ